MLIRDRTLFETKVIPKFFKHSNLPSFVRQLNVCVYLLFSFLCLQSRVFVDDFFRCRVMCVCVCVCVCVRVYLCSGKKQCNCVFVYQLRCLADAILHSRTLTQRHIQIYIHAYTYTYIYIYVYIYLCACVCVWLHAHIIYLPTTAITLSYCRVTVRLHKLSQMSTELTFGNFYQLYGFHKTTQDPEVCEFQHKYFKQDQVSEHSCKDRCVHAVVLGNTRTRRAK